MPPETYTVRAVVEPGRSMDNEAMPRGVLVGFLRGLADGLEQNTESTITRLSIHLAPGQEKTPAEREHREMHDGTRTFIPGGDDAAH